MIIIFIHITHNNFLVPAPMLTSVTSNPASPIRPIGSAVTLICTVVLSPAVDVPVTINIHLNDPVGSPLITTTPSVSGSNYTSIATVNSFGREDSGLYMCRVSISSTLPFIRNSNPKSVASKVTVGETIMFGSLACMQIMDKLLSKGWFPNTVTCCHEIILECYINVIGH